MRAPSLLIVFVAVAAAQVARAQTTPAAGRGDRVRLLVDGDKPKITGRFISATDGVVTVATGDTVQRFRVELVRRFEVASGKRGHAFRGFKIGALAGAAIGAGIGYARKPTGLCPDAGQACGSRIDRANVGATVGGVLGAISGTVIGAAVRTTRWEPVVSPLFFAPGTGRHASIRIGIAVRK